MSDVLNAAILGVIQGLTEFLPVSSTGHLIIGQHVLGLSDNQFGLQFDAAIHLGTLAAVLIYFRVTVWNLARGWIASISARRWDLTNESRLAWLLIVGTIPAAIAGVLLESSADHAFRSPILVGAMLIVFCLPMWLADRYGRGERDISSASTFDALLVGAAQAIALIPGVSRSGITISAGMMDGFRRDEAAVFAFLLSAPIIAGAGGKKLLDVIRGHAESTTVHNEAAVYAIGMIAAAIVGYAAIAFLIRFLRFNPLTAFIRYRIAMGTLVIALALAGVL